MEESHLPDISAKVHARFKLQKDDIMRKMIEKEVKQHESTSMYSHRRAQYLLALGVIAVHQLWKFNKVATGHFQGSPLKRGCR